jgi:hypothetical protein
MGDQPGWWRIHDAVVGVLAGGATGVITGLFALRIIEHPGVPLALGAVGAAAGVWWLRARRSGRFASPARVTAWTVAGLGVAFLVALGRAIATFN